MLMLLLLKLLYLTSVDLAYKTRVGGLGIMRVVRQAGLDDDDQTNDLIFLLFCKHEHLQSNENQGNDAMAIKLLAERVSKRAMQEL
jgi:hypothetical protein